MRKEKQKREDRERYCEALRVAAKSTSNRYLRLDLLELRRKLQWPQSGESQAVDAHTEGAPR